MWRSRWRCVIKPTYSVSFLLSINIFVWQNVLYFLDDPRIYAIICISDVKKSYTYIKCTNRLVYNLTGTHGRSQACELTWNKEKTQQCIHNCLSFMSVCRHDTQSVSLTAVLSTTALTGCDGGSTLSIRWNERSHSRKRQKDVCTSLATFCSIVSCEEMSVNVLI